VLVGDPGFFFRAVKGKKPFLSIRSHDFSNLISFNPSPGLFDIPGILEDIRTIAIPHQPWHHTGSPHGNAKLIL